MRKVLHGLDLGLWDVRRGKLHAQTVALSRLPGQSTGCDDACSPGEATLGRIRRDVKGYPSVHVIRTKRATEHSEQTRWPCPTTWQLESNAP